jgi:hypothetical protein
MKATFPADRAGVIEHMRGTFTVDVDVSTADLIAELEKRRPCDKCRAECVKPEGICVWYSHRNVDNFKEQLK